MRKILPWRAAPGSWAEALGLAAAVAGLILCFFSPHFLHWQAWSRVPELFYGPETGRAASALWQADHLGEEIPDPIHRIIRWRVLFPLVAHGLHLPGRGHLALYPLGALLTLAMAARLFRERELSRRLTLAALFALGANAWFFTSAGWLAYADGWVAAGLLVVAFSRRLWPAVAAVLVIPWCDDRFILALPLALGCRWWLARPEEPTTLPILLREAMWLASATGTYGAARLGLERFWGASLAGYEAHSVPAFWGREGTFLWGAWECWRAAWILPGMAFLRAEKPWIKWVGIVAAAATFSSAFFTAFDLSRAGVVLIPLSVAGLLRAVAAERGRHAVVWVAAANALLPAAFIIADLQTPILPLRAEWAQWRRPPAPYAASGYATSALEAIRAKQETQAERLLGIALRLDPAAPAVAQSRAMIAWEKGERGGALESLRRHLRAEPGDYGSGVLLVKMLIAGGNTAEAQSVGANLRRQAPADDPCQAQIESALREGR